MSRRRKTKAHAKELKTRHEENPFEDFTGSNSELYLLKFLHWVKQNLKAVVIGVVVTVTIASVIVIYFAWNQNIEKNSLFAFEKIISTHSASSKMSSAHLAISDLEKYEKEFSSTGTQVRSSVFKIQFLVKNEDYEKAAENCIQIAQQLDSKSLKAYFQIKAGFLYERVGKKEKALKAYQQTALNSTDSNIITVHARYGEIRMLLATKRSTDARSVLNKLLEIKEDRPDIKKLQRQALALVLTKGQQ